MHDMISRQAAIEKFEPWLTVGGYSEGERNMLRAVLYEIRFLPSAQSDIIRCKDCKRHNIGIGDFREDGNTRQWLWKDEACPLVQYRGKAQGHEFDYQFCAYAERKADDE